MLHVCPASLWPKAPPELPRAIPEQFDSGANQALHRPKLERMPSMLLGAWGNSKSIHVLVQVRVPAALPRRETLELVHEPEFLRAFCDGALSSEAVKRIGFGEVVRSPVLVERTLAEVAGAGRPDPPPPCLLALRRTL